MALMPNWCNTGGLQSPSTKRNEKLGFTDKNQIDLGFALFTPQASHPQSQVLKSLKNFNWKVLLHSLSNNKRSLEPIYRLRNNSLLENNWRGTKHSHKRKPLISK